VSDDAWSIPGAEGQPIIGNTHMPAGRPRGVIVIAHGFKGYKDYGMFPRIARECAAHGDLVAHRFNFSHSGMTNRLETFERPDLFERDTWNKQVFDLICVMRAIGQGELAGRGLPLYVLGHSRGGVSTLLIAARLTYPRSFPDGVKVTPPAGVITLAAPASCNPLSAQEQQELLRQGSLESPSSRTGQRMRIGRPFLQEQMDDPGGHDLLGQVARINCPILVIHGERDPTVPLQAAHDIANAAGSRGRLMIVPGGDHVFNTPNPMPDDQAASPQLQTVIDTTLQFANALGVQ
jgi:pimeloyl-ACP methyl ester carboxylesterase